jgi:type VI secretion system protein VasI
MTDETNIVLKVSSDEPVRCRWNRSHRATLHVRCLENTTALYSHTGCHMTSRERLNNPGNPPKTSFKPLILRTTDCISPDCSVLS